MPVPYRLGPRGFHVPDFTSPSTYEKTRLPVEKATTLPPEMYRSAECFALENERLFGKSWVCVGYLSQVDAPGKTISTTVGGQPLVVTCTRDRELKAFFNVCRHRGSLLVLQEECKIERFRCPYHAWTYDLGGALQNAPLFSTSEPFDKGEFGLLPVRVERWGAFVFVNLDPQAQPLTEFLGDLTTRYSGFPLDELVLVRRKKYEIRANWKLIAENFLEYYHLPWVHPELCTVTAIDMHKRNQGPGMYMSFYASPLLQGGTPIDANFLPPMPGLGEAEANSGYFPLVFPNLAMFLMPHHVFALLMQPTAADATSEYGDILVHPSVLERPDHEKEIDAILAFYDMVNVQDIVAVERVQKGIQARAYPGGRMTYRFEEPVHRFQNMVIDFLVNERRTYAGDP